MKKLIAIALLLLATGAVKSQDWISLNEVGGTPVYLHEINIDQATNNVVYNRVYQIMRIKPDGTNELFGNPVDADLQFSGATLHSQYHNGAIYFVTPEDAVRKIILTPEYKDTVIHSTNIENILMDHDTIWVSGNTLGSSTQIINESIHQPFVSGAHRMIKYKGQVYSHSTTSGNYGVYYHNGIDHIQFSEDNSDILSNYIGGFCTNSEDGILFVGTKVGLSQFNGVTFSNITPDNHPDMPYKTVIDIEYDHKNGKLWMILGDTNFNAKTLTSYNGSWETYDNTNSPIDFDLFKDMAVDTLGQVWVGESNEIHVLNTDELQGWLGIKKQEQLELEVNVYPNPSTGIVNIQIEKQGTFTLKVYNSNGQEVYQNSKATGSMELDLPKGIYHYTVSDGQTKFKSGKIIRL
jgi:hypothetical protein